MVVNNFRDFHQRFVKLFRFFGIVPIYYTDATENIIKLKPLHTGFSTCFLAVYWTGVTLTFLIKHHQKKNKISEISNWIQMLANALALTTILVCGTLKYKDIDMILKQFEKIDNALCSIGQKVNYAKQVFRTNLILTIYFSLMICILSFDYYVTVHLLKMISSWYWLVSLTPLFLNSMGLLHAMFMIYWIKCRCELINQSLKAILSKTNSNLISITQSSSTFMSADFEQGSGTNLIRTNTSRAMDLLQKDSKNAKDSDSKILAKLFTTINDLSMLTHQIDNYFGLILLSTIGSLFAITTIQVYYCFITAMKLSDKMDQTIWTLFVGLNIVLLNLSLIIGITSVCESVSYAGKMIWQNFSTLQIQKEITIMNELSSWIYSKVTNLKVSAFGFFPIDHNMLNGFIAALITYLIIFIQFNWNSSDKEPSSTHANSVTIDISKLNVNNYRTHPNM